jgi:hypothetical protein
MTDEPDDLEYVFAPPKKKRVIEVVDLSLRAHHESVICWCEPECSWIPEADTWHIVHNEPKAGEN